MEVVKEKEFGGGGTNHQQLAGPQQMAAPGQQAPPFGIQYIDIPVPMYQPPVYAPPISQPYEAMEFGREVHSERREYRRDYRYDGQENRRRDVTLPRQPMQLSDPRREVGYAACPLCHPLESIVSARHKVCWLTTHDSMCRVAPRAGCDHRAPRRWRARRWRAGRWSPDPQARCAGGRGASARKGCSPAADELVVQATPRAQRRLPSFQS